MSLRHSLSTMQAVMLFCMAGVVWADEEKTLTDTLQPVIPKGQGEACVEETGFMRRNHMEILDHQRDETVLKGVRDKQYSLTECLSCHAVYGTDSIAVTVTSPNHFCRSCHDYVAVSIDCFECHASRPESSEAPADHRLSGTASGTSSTNGSD